MTRHETPSVLAEGLRFAPRKVLIEKRPGGTLVLRSPIEFETPNWSILDFIPEWAEKAPQRAFLAQRGKGIPFSSPHEGDHDDGDFPPAD